MLRNKDCEHGGLGRYDGTLDCDAVHPHLTAQSVFADTSLLPMLPMYDWAAATIR